MIIQNIIAFPFYNKIEMQNRFKDNSKVNKPYYLITPNDSFLPFQIISKELVEVIKIELFFMCGNSIDISENKALLNVVQSSIGVIFTYNGDELILNGKPLKLDSEPQYLKVTFSNESVCYSEVFCPRDFKASEVNKYLTLEYYSDKDVGDIYYQGGFKQRVYLDSFVHNNEPEIEEEVKENGKGQVLPLSQKMVINHLIVDVVPDFLKLALTSVQMHEFIKVVDTYNRQEIQAERAVISSTPTTDGAYSNIEIKLRQILLSLSACN